MSRAYSLSFLGMFVITLSAGCKSDRQPKNTEAASMTSAEPAKAASGAVTVRATDFQFDAPNSVPAGPVRIDFANNGKELHQVQLVKLEDGKTIDDLKKALQTPGPPPKWIKWLGGPNGIAPGKKAQATSELAPGNYALLCLIPSPDGTIHAAKGMIRPFEVTSASSASYSEAPSADVTVSLADYSFKVSQPLSPGRHTIMVENGGRQEHEIVLLKLAPGKRTDDFGKWAMTMKGPPPAEPIGGVTALDPGARGSFTADLTPGEYGFICFVPDAKDGKPHFVHGMMQTFKVG